MDERLRRWREAQAAIDLKVRGAREGAGPAPSPADAAAPPRARDAKGISAPVEAAPIGRRVPRQRTSPSSIDVATTGPRRPMASTGSFEGFGTARRTADDEDGRPSAPSHRRRSPARRASRRHPVRGHRGCLPVRSALFGPGELVGYRIQYRRRTRVFVFRTLYADDPLAASVPGVRPRVHLLLGARDARARPACARPLRVPGQAGPRAVELARLLLCPRGLRAGRAAAHPGDPAVAAVSTPNPERFMDVATLSCTLQDDDEVLPPCGAAAKSCAARGGGVPVLEAELLP